MPRVFSKEKKPGRQTAPMGFLPVEPRFFRQFNETSFMVFPLVEPNALFDLLHTDGLAFFYKNMNFTVPNRPNQPDQFLLLGSQFYALLRVHIPPDFLLKHYRVICHASVPRSQGGRIQRQSILQAGARGYASHVITIYRGDFSINESPAPVRAKENALCISTAESNTTRPHSGVWFGLPVPAEVKELP